MSTMTIMVGVALRSVSSGKITKLSKLGLIKADTKTVYLLIASITMATMNRLTVDGQLFPSSATTNGTTASLSLMAKHTPQLSGQG